MDCWYPVWTLTSGSLLSEAWPLSNFGMNIGMYGWPSGWYTLQPMFVNGRLLCAVSRQSLGTTSQMLLKNLVPGSSNAVYFAFYSQHFVSMRNFVKAKFAVLRNTSILLCLVRHAVQPRSAVVDDGKFLAWPDSV